MAGIFMPYHPSDLKSRLDMYPKGHRGYATPGVDYGPGGYKAGSIERPIVASEREIDRRIGNIMGQKVGDKDPFKEKIVKTRIKSRRDSLEKAESLNEQLIKKSKQIEAAEAAMNDRMPDRKDPRNKRKSLRSPEQVKEMIAKMALSTRKLRQFLDKYPRDSSKKSDFNYKDNRPTDRHAKPVVEHSVQSKVKYSRAELGLEPYQNYRMNPERRRMTKEEFDKLPFGQMSRDKKPKGSTVLAK